MYKTLISSHLLSSRPSHDEKPTLKAQNSLIKVDTSNDSSKSQIGMKEVVERLNGSALSSEMASTSENQTKEEKSIEDEMDEYFNCEDFQEDDLEYQTVRDKVPIKTSEKKSASLSKEVVGQKSNETHTSI